MKVQTRMFLINIPTEILPDMKHYVTNPTVHTNIVRTLYSTIRLIYKKDGRWFEWTVLVHSSWVFLHWNPTVIKTYLTKSGIWKYRMNVTFIVWTSISNTVAFKWTALVYFVTLFVCWNRFDYRITIYHKATHYRKNSIFDCWSSVSLWHGEFHGNGTGSLFNIISMIYSGHYIRWFPFTKYYFQDELNWIKVSFLNLIFFWCLF